MKVAGVLLLLAGWLLVLAAIALLPTIRSRGGFVVAGMGVQALGLTLLFRSHRLLRGE